VLKQVPVAEALDHKFPEWLVFVVTHDPAGRDDLMPAGWAMCCSAQPPMLAVALGAGRHSLALIQRTREFGIGFAGPEQVQTLTFSGSCSGRDVDKFAALGLATQPGAVTSVPLLVGCTLFFECRLAGALPAGDHVVVTGEIAAAHRADPPLANLVNFGGWYSPAGPLWPPQATATRRPLAADS
jgi:flavin reductase (DIM6/NTAB) family NADH-FMN oxidoreductase RutF